MKLDSDEFLELVPLKIDQAFSMVFSGEIVDVKTIIGIMWYHKLITKVK